MRYLLDTNVVLYFLGGRLAESLPMGQYLVSVITEIELLSYPALDQEEERHIRAFLNELPVVDLSPSIREKSVELRRRNRLKLPDAIVAATASIEAAILLTNDEGLLGISGVDARRVPLHT